MDENYFIICVMMFVLLKPIGLDLIGVGWESDTGALYTIHPSIHSIYISFYWMLMCSKILNTSSQRTRNTKFLYSFPAVVKQDGFDQLQFHSLSIECSILWYVWMIQRFRLKAGWVRIEKDTADDFMMICQNLKLQNVFWISGDRWKSFFSVRYMSDESAE